MSRGDGAARLYIEVERCEPESDGDRATGLVRAEGEIDLDTVERLADSLDPNLWQGCEGVLVDLTAVTFLDSSGISALIRAGRDLEAAGLRLAVTTAPRTQVEGVLDLTGVRDSIPSAL